MTRNEESLALAKDYCAWLNEAARIRERLAELGSRPPFTIENMWRVPLAAQETGAGKGEK